MGFEKAIEHKKTKRKPYRRSKAFDKSCRNHGSCAWCQKNRHHKNIIREQKANEEALSINNEDDYEPHYDNEEDSIL